MDTLQVIGVLIIAGVVLWQLINIRFALESIAHSLATLRESGVKQAVRGAAVAVQRDERDTTTRGH